MKHLIVGKCPPLIRDFARKMWENYSPHPYLEEYLRRIGHPEFDPRDPRNLFYELEERNITNVERFMEFVWENRDANFPVSETPPAGFISGAHIRMSSTSTGREPERPATFWENLQYHGIGNALLLY